MRQSRREENKRRNRKWGAIVFTIFGTATLILSVYLFGGFAPTDTSYDYDIKAEQVYDNDKISDSVELQKLSQDEQDLLYDAFKKSDHFFGSEEVTITRDSKLDTFDGWKVVEFQGVYILVAISGPDSYSMYDGWFPLLAFVSWFIILATTMVGLKEIVAPSPY